MFFDADGDGDLDLYVCSGGNEFSANSTELIDHLYINRWERSFQQIAAGVAVLSVRKQLLCTAADFDGDGDLDLFVGVRLKPDNTAILVKDTSCK